MKSFVLCRIPRAGLGNQLLVWAKALAYAQTHQLDMVHWGWSLPSRTRISRIGQGNETWISKVRPSPPPKLIWYLSHSLHCESVHEPCMSLQPKPEGVVYHFGLVPPWQDYFADFRGHRPQVISGLMKILRPGVKSQAEKPAPPLVVVNVRMGDFRQLPQGVDFALVGQHRTPLDYFKSVIQGIRHISGWDVPIHLVSDGTPAELASLLSFKDVILAPQRPAIVQLLWMSKARAIVCSSGSTFSFWAGFLGDAALLHHPAHVPRPVRPADKSGALFDGAAGEDWREWPQLLIDNLETIKPAP